MVKVRQDHPVTADGNVDIDAWIERLHGINAQSSETHAELQRACQVSLDSAAIASDFEHNWGGDANSFRIGLEMAEILAELQLDQDTLVAAILYRAVREDKLSIAKVQEQFGDTVVKLVRGVVRDRKSTRLNSSHVR